MITVDDLRPWSDDASVSGVLAGGVRSEVVRVHIGGVVMVARRSRRRSDSLDWELDLLEHLDAHGFVVPRTLPTEYGLRCVGGLTVHSWLDGDEPTSASDWDLIVTELNRLHQVTLGWPQRPGSVSAHDLLVVDAGGDVDLGTMPTAAVRACRTAWAALPTPAPDERSVVHGDPGAPNLRICDGRVGIIDWDEARVDHPWFDLADVPTRPLPSADAERAARAAHAWEAASGWNIEPEYARARLAQLRPERRPGDGGRA